MAAVRNLKFATATQRAVLSKMHLGKKTEYDMFDFPGVSPGVFDELSDKYEALVGNHRDGWRVSRIGAAFASKLENVK